MMESEKANMIEMQEMFIGLEEGRAEQISDTESDHDVAPVSDGNREGRPIEMNERNPVGIHIEEIISTIKAVIILLIFIVLIIGLCLDNLTYEMSYNTEEQHNKFVQCGWTGKYIQGGERIAYIGMDASVASLALFMMIAAIITNMIGFILTQQCYKFTICGTLKNIWCTISMFMSLLSIMIWYFGPSRQNCTASHHALGGTFVCNIFAIILDGIVIMISCILVLHHRNRRAKINNI